MIDELIKQAEGYLQKIGYYAPDYIPCRQDNLIHQLLEALKASQENMDSEQAGELLPCPFHTYPSMVDAIENDYGKWQVGCGACGSFTGTYRTKLGAIIAWNMRATPDISKVLDSEDLVEDVAKEIWETAQADCEYTVDPTQGECRLLAQAAIKVIKERLK